MPEYIGSTGRLQTRLLLFYADIINELVESGNEKFEDLTKFIRKETVLFMAELLKRLLHFYKNGVLIDDFIKIIFDKKIIAA